MHVPDQPPPAVPEDGVPTGLAGGDAPEDGVLTGDAAVDEALGRLAGLADLPVHEHVAVFDAVHAELQDRLADVEG